MKTKFKFYLWEESNKEKAIYIIPNYGTGFSLIKQNNNMFNRGCCDWIEEEMLRFNNKLITFQEANKIVGKELLNSYLIQFAPKKLSKWQKAWKQN